MRSYTLSRRTLFVIAVLLMLGSLLFGYWSIDPLRAQAQSPFATPRAIAADEFRYYFPIVMKSCQEYCVGWAVGGMANGYGVILRTDDSGANWKRQGQIGMIPNESTEGVSAVDAQNAWVVSDRTILRTRDGGATWESQSLPSGLPANYVFTQVKALDANIAFVVGSPSVVLQTSDGGIAWSKMATRSDLPAIRFSEVDAVDTTHVWAVGGIITGTSEVPNMRAGLAIAFYNGVQWQSQLLAPSLEICNSFIGLSAVDPNTAWAVGGVNCPPYKTIDGGATWQAIGASLNPFDTNRVVAVTSDVVWIAHDFGVRQTTNGGATWDSITTGCPAGGYCYAISAAGTQHVWLSDLAYAPPGNLFRWVNADHWEKQTVPAKANIVALSFVGARR